MAASRSNIKLVWQCKLIMVFVDLCFGMATAICGARIWHKFSVVAVIVEHSLVELAGVEFGMVVVDL